MNILSSSQAARILRRRALAFAPVWNRREGAALPELCEREYWQRMWIIQEAIRAEKIQYGVALCHLTGRLLLICCTQR